jgi:pimeloyl-ACP methyl ester carboxylesterase
MVSSAVWAVASREIISRTVFASLMFAMWPIALLKLSKVVDNPFNVAKSRADKAGLVLADAIINKAQGKRPVTLIGYSMGARLIYSCLMSLAERRAFGLVESAVLIGAPAPSDASVWRAIRSVVAGRLVNVYSEKDYVLAFLYRTSSIQLVLLVLRQWTV